MTTAQVTLEELPIEFAVPGAAGFTIDVLEAEVMLEELSDGWKKDFREYSGALKQKLRELKSVTLSDSQLFKFVEAIVASYAAFKKKLDAELPLALGLE